MKPGFLQIRRCTFPTWGENWRHAFKLMECIFHLFIPEGIRHTHTHTHRHARTHYPPASPSSTPTPPRTPLTSHPKSWECLHVVQTENERQKLGTPVTTYHRTKFSSKSESPPPRYQHIFFHLPEPLFVKLPSTLLPREVFFFFFPPVASTVTTFPPFPSRLSQCGAKHTQPAAAARVSFTKKQLRVIAY